MTDQERDQWSLTLRDKYGIAEPEADVSEDDIYDYCVD